MRKTPRVAAVHDMSGFGRCSLTVVLPTLAAMGAQGCPLQTAYLSAHTGFPKSDKSVFFDLTGPMEGTVAHWRELGIKFDAIYSGFLGSAEQIDLLCSFADEFGGGDTLVVVDPVMGDHGTAYRTYTPELCRRMSELAGKAGLVTPNLTEAAILLGEAYDASPDRAKVDEWLRRLSLDGRRSVVITGVSFAPGTLGAGAFDAHTGVISYAMAEEAPARFSGTGDLFTSVTLGGLLRGEILADASARAVEFVQKCAAATVAAGDLPVEGVRFEALLGELAGEGSHG